jgi:iron(III) transport system substrate-binding protein
MFKYKVFKFLLFCIVFLQILKFSSYASEVNVFTSRHYESDSTLYKIFTKETGIKVNIISGDAKALEKRILEEGKNSRADIFITVDAGALGSAQNKGIFQEINSKKLENSIPLSFRTKYWFGITKRARLIYYNPEKVKKEEIKNLSYEDLSDVKWKNRIVIRSSSHIYNLSLVSSLIENIGINKTEIWLKNFVSNFAKEPEGGDREQILAVASGEADIAIANSYYIAIMLSGEKGEEQKIAAQKVKVLFPNQNNRGTHMNISGGGVLRYSPNKENAIKFLEFLLTKTAQQYFADNTYEYPMINNVKLNPLIQQFGSEFKQDQSTKVETYYKNQKISLQLMKLAGWK